MAFPHHLQSIEIGSRRLELFVPDAAAVKEAYEQGQLPFPYWSKVWPAAIGLCQFLLRYPELLENKTVVEAGAGLGLPSFIAAEKAATVLCTDSAPEAVAIVAQTISHHHLQNMQAAAMDWQQLPGAVTPDVLLLSDVNYSPDAFAELWKMINYFLEKGTTLILSTPQRLLAKDFIAPLLASCRQQEEETVMESGKEVQVTVLLLKK